VITAKSYLLNSLVTALLLTIFAEPALANEYDTTDSSLIIKEQARSLLNQMSLDEKISLLSGRGMYDTQNISRLNIPSLQLWDGPNGIRSNKNQPTTAFPVGVAMGATWNRSLIGELGKALGRECRASGVEVLLGPTVNIIRTPLGGRNFETFSEDPHLTGEIGVAYVKGLQSQHVGCSVKHYIANNQEKNRNSISAEVSERALREIYLPGYKKIVQEADPMSIMAAYNQINGVFASEHTYLIDEILRGVCGFEGVVLSDWGAVKSTIPSLTAGLDLEMPGPGNFYEKPLRKALKTGEISEELVNNSTLRMLELILKTSTLNENINDTTYTLSNEMKKNRALARRVAEESIVLLKNEGGLLPINPDSIITIAVVGPNADRGIGQGGGSARVISQHNITPLDGIRSISTKHSIAVIAHKGVENHPTVPVIETALILPAEGSLESGLKGEYFKSPDFSGSPYKTVTDKVLRIFGLIEGVDSFASIKWTGIFMAPQTGEYRFSANAGLGKAKIFLDHKQIRFTEKSPPLFGGRIPGARIGTIFLAEGNHPIRIEYSARMNFFMRLMLKLLMPGMSDILENFRLLEIGCRVPEPDMNAAIEAAKNADLTIIVAGTPDNYETEGDDRPSMELPGKQDEFIQAILGANENSVVVINSGSPVEMPWADKSRAIVQLWLPGQEGGTALANVLFGLINPSGKIPVTFPKILTDNPSFNNYPGDKVVKYEEGLYVGYRHYESKQIETLFPFGHGLSYTRFDFDSFAAPKSVKMGNEFQASLTITNVGDVSGSEVVQLYIKDVTASVDRPFKELKGFSKVHLQPGESKLVSFAINEQDLSFFDTGQGKWVAEPGEFVLLVGNSSKEIKIQQTIYLIE